MYMHISTYTSFTFIITIPRLQFTHGFEDEKRHMERVAFWETVSHAVSSDAYFKFQQM